MFGQYQCVSGSEDDSSHSQTLSFPRAYSSKKKLIPLQKKIRHSQNNRVLKPLRIIYTSPDGAENSNFNNTLEETKKMKEKIVDNSLGNIQEMPENEPMVDSLNPASDVHDSFDDLFPSGKSKFKNLKHELVDCNFKTEMNRSEIHEQQSQNMDVTPPVINNNANFHVLEDIGNQRDLSHKKIKVEIKKTPIHLNCNRDINIVCRETNDKENIAISTNSRLTPGICDILYRSSSTSIQPDFLCSEEKKTIIPKMVREEICSKKKIEFQTPDKVPRDAMMPPHTVSQTRLMPEQKLQNCFVINGKMYEMQSILGRGGSSKVYQVVDYGTSHQLAVKEVDLSLGESSVTQGYLQEIDLLKKLQGSKSVIKMIAYEYQREKEKLYVVMEKGEIDLSRLMKEITNIEPMPITTIVHYWTEMLRAVKDIHAKNVIHSDLKPANFLLVRGRLKLIDFGIASAVQNDMTSVYKDVQTGTYNYISPEALQVTCNNNQNGIIRISYKSDIWSLGCILYNLLYGKTPFQNIVPFLAKLAAITNKNHCIEYPATSKDCPPVLLYAVKQCLIYDPKKRPSAAQLLELPYINPHQPY